MKPETTRHLIAWIEHQESDQDRGFALFSLMLDFLQDYPDTLSTHSWPEIRSLAERRLAS